MGFILARNFKGFYIILIAVLKIPAWINAYSDRSSPTASGATLQCDKEKKTSYLIFPHILASISAVQMQMCMKENVRVFVSVVMRKCSEKFV